MCKMRLIIFLLNLLLESRGTILTFVIGVLSCATGLEYRSFSNQFRMKAEITNEDAKAFAERNGFILRRKVLDGYFVMERPEVPMKSTQPSKWKTRDLLKLYPKIASIEQEEYVQHYPRHRPPSKTTVRQESVARNYNTHMRKETTQSSETKLPQKSSNSTVSPEKISHREKRFVQRSVSFQRLSGITDPLWRNMWHLQPRQTPSMKVYNAWQRGYTGSGITVGIVDDGIDTTHEDLKKNFDPNVSFDYIHHTYNVAHSLLDEGHGTKCAGIVAAEKNNGNCIAGIAYGATIGAIKIRDASRAATPSEEASALIHHLSSYDIYSNSWGPSDYGNIFGEMKPIVNVALQHGVTMGRNGKGAIYIWASGNGGKADDCNCDAYANSIYTIAVSSVSSNGKPPYYAETCTATLTSTYGGSYPLPMISTTARDNRCTSSFEGTSASCSMASGIIALALQANSQLSWRDVQHIIVETSTTTGLVGGNFKLNGSGRKVSLFFGFGLMNADAIITKAVSWKTVPSIFTTSVWVNFTLRTPQGPILSHIAINCPIKYAEHIEATIDFDAPIRGKVTFYLTSPQGTECRLLGPRYNDTKPTLALGETWTFMTVHSWGEDPNDTFHLNSWNLTIHGTLTNPILGTPAAGEYGGACRFYKRCKSLQHVCRDELCRECDPGFHPRNNVCIEDGSHGGFCSSIVKCRESNEVCSSSTCQCSAGYTYINDSSGCLRDGYPSGVCFANKSCNDPTHVACQNGRCIRCTHGYSNIQNQCMEDGDPGGACLRHNTCNNSTHVVCRNDTHLCTICSTGFRNINGTCMIAGRYGDLCHVNVSCIDYHTICSNIRCRCETGYSYIVEYGQCNKDGEDGGLCLGRNRCSNTAICLVDKQICDNCPYRFRNINNTCMEDSANNDEESSATTYGIVIICVLCGLLFISFGLCIWYKRCRKTNKGRRIKTTKSRPSMVYPSMQSNDVAVSHNAKHVTFPARPMFNSNGKTMFKMAFRGSDTAVNKQNEATNKLAGFHKVSSTPKKLFSQAPRDVDHAYHTRSIKNNIMTVPRDNLRSVSNGTQSAEMYNQPRQNKAIAYAGPTPSISSKVFGTDNLEF